MLRMLRKEGRKDAEKRRAVKPKSVLKINLFGNVDSVNSFVRGFGKDACRQIPTTRAITS